MTFYHVLADIIGSDYESVLNHVCELQRHHKRGDYLRRAKLKFDIEDNALGGKLSKHYSFTDPREDAKCVTCKNPALDGEILCANCIKNEKPVENLCIIPGCNRERYKNPQGRYKHKYCRPHCNIWARRRKIFRKKLNKT